MSGQITVVVMGVVVEPNDGCVVRLVPTKERKSEWCYELLTCLIFINVPVICGVVSDDAEPVVVPEQNIKYEALF